VFKLGSGFGFGLGLASVGLAGLGIGSGAGLFGCFSLFFVLVAAPSDLSCEIDACNINSSICCCACAFSSALSARMLLSERCTSWTALTAG